MRLFAAAAALAAVAVAVPADDIDPRVRVVLARSLHFTATELDDLARGRVVKHSIDDSTAGEIAVAGAVRIDARKAAFIDRVRDIERFKQGTEILEIGRFSNPPVAADLDRLTVNKEDFDVRECRVGDCPIRLPADIIRRFQQEIDPRAPDVQRRTESLFKQVLLDSVTAYVTGGPGRISSYDDESRSIKPAVEFEGLVAGESSLDSLVPGLSAHLRDYPLAPLEGSEDFLYWSKEKFGSEPFITVTHVAIVCPSPRTCVVATRDVYSTRYVDASLAVSIASDTVSDSARFYLVYANRSRASAMKGAMSGLRRTMVGRRARGGIEDTLKHIKAQLEAKR
jgi:hypothetical protein